MGQLRNGTWKTENLISTDEGGGFQRKESSWRDWITADGSSGYKAESGRYHLYVAYACPWAHRTLIFRALKGLAEHISVDVVHPFMGENGWHFGTDFDGATGDSLFGSEFLHQIYTRSDSDATTRVTVPILWDKETGRIVSNSDDDLMRILNSEFDAFTDSKLNLVPEDKLSEIDALNDWIYDRVNDGVYKAGFASSQSAYESALNPLFGALDELDQRLEQTRYLFGDQPLETDWRLFVTLVRFDAAYVGHFKCNLRRIADYPNLGSYLKDLYQIPGIAETVNFDHIKRHYYETHHEINPTGIVPVGPVLDLESPHGRG